MGQNKPQGIPEAVRVAQDVLQDLLPELDDAHAQALRKKLPAYALMLAQKDGQTPTAETLREAAFSLTGAFGRVAGGGALSLADYNRIRDELLVEKDNPWIAVMAAGDSEGYLRLRRETPFPRNAPSWKLMLDGLSQAADPLPLLGMLLRDNVNIEQVETLCGTSPFAIVLAHFDRALEIPEMREIMRARTNYMRFPAYLAAQGRHDVLDRLYGPEDWQGMDDTASGRMVITALRAGHRATAEYVLVRCPDAIRSVGVVEAFAVAGWTEPLLSYLDSVPEDFVRRDKAKFYMAAALETGQWDTALALERYGVTVSQTARSRELMYRVAAQGRVDTIQKLNDKGFFDDVSSLMLAELCDIARRYNKTENRALLESLLKTREGYGKSRLELNEHAAVKDWQLQSLRRALEEGAPVPVVTYLAVDILGARNIREDYDRAGIAPPGQAADPAAQELDRYIRSRGTNHGLVGMMRQGTDALMKHGNLGAIVESFAALQAVYREVKSTIGERSDLAASVVRETYNRSYELQVSDFLVRVAEAKGWSGCDLAEIFKSIDSLSPRVAQHIANSAVQCQRWLLLRELIAGGHLDVIPEKRDELRAHPVYAARMQGAHAWDRILPGRDVGPNMLTQPVKNIRPALLRDVAALIESETMDPGGSLSAAYRLCAVFRSEDRIMRYLERWGAKIKQDKLTLMSLAQTITFPEKEPAIDPGAWGDFLLRYGPEAGKLVRYADRLAAPTGSMNEMREQAAQYHYRRGRENPALSAFCFRRNVSEEAHDQALALLARKAALEVPRVQRIPDMQIDGEEFGMKGARFYRLKDNDFRALFLGLLVDCCQHLDKWNGNAAAAWCARHGFQSEHGGFYVIETNEGEIIGETWAWRATGGQMVFDSLETLGKNMTDNCRVTKAQWSALMERVKDRLAADPGDITALMVGTDGQRCPLLNYNVPNAAPAPYAKAAYPAKPLDHKGYSDSREQYLFWAAEGYQDEPQAEAPLPVPEWAAPEAAPMQPQRNLFAEVAPPRAIVGQILGEGGVPVGQVFGGRAPERRDPHMVWQDDGGADPFRPAWARRFPGLLP